MTGRPTLSAGATRQAMVSSNSREWSGMLKDSGAHFSEPSLNPTIGVLGTTLNKLLQL
ncbi:hypothetical protein ISCGN_000247 [Ixodes scapularis]